MIEDDSSKSRVMLGDEAVPRYVYQFSPSQLIFLCKCLADTKNIQGNIVEVGCEHGHTTLFLNYLIDEDVKDKRKYFAVDTFSGFCSDDIEFEIKERLKKGIVYDQFRNNSKENFDATMRASGMDRVCSIEANVNKFDLQSLGSLSFAILDVDLYRPTMKALPELYAALSPGGMIVVDDCDSFNRYWDGAFQAYMEFVESIEKTPRIVCRKLGLIRKDVQ